MPQFKLTNLATYRSYFQAIATSHVDIDGFKWGDKDVLRNDNRSDMPEKLLWVQPYESVRFLDAGSDNVQKVKLARVAYMIVPDSEKFSDEDAALDVCEALIEQIVAKILLDKRGSDGAGEWSLLITRITSFTAGPVEYKFGGTKYIGYELKIEFQDPANLTYNPEKWAS